ARAMNGSRMAEIRAHPFGRGSALQFCRSNLSGGSFVLSFPSERIVVTAVPKVEKASDRHLEIQSSIQGAPRSDRKEGLRRWPLAKLFHSRNQSEPVRNVVVTQPARTIFYV